MRKMKDKAMIEAWALIYVSAIDQSKEIRENRHKEIPPDGMLNLIESELPDLRNLWNATLSENATHITQGGESVLHALALLCNNVQYWRNENEQLDTIIHVIAGYSVEALLRPPSSIQARRFKIPYKQNILSYIFCNFE